MSPTDLLGVLPLSYLQYITSNDCAAKTAIRMLSFQFCRFSVIVMTEEVQIALDVITAVDTPTGIHERVRFKTHLTYSD